MVNATAALVGTTGGAGTTRLAVELAATLARDGRDVAVLDADFETQGLARHVSGRIDPDVTKLLTEDADLADCLYDRHRDLDVPGRLAVCPADAPFERLARAKTAAAAERFERAVADAAREFDHVLVDTPPVAANQAVAAVTAVDRVALVAPDTDRGSDAVQRARGRLADVGTSADAVVANRAREDRVLRAADAAVPVSDATTVAAGPASVRNPDGTFAQSVAQTAEAVLDVTMDLQLPEGGLLNVDREQLLPDSLS